MPSVFSLWGELKVNTAGFESALTKSVSSLKKTETALERTERAATRTGAAASGASRGIDRMRNSSATAATAASRLGSYVGVLAGGAIATMAGMAVKSAISFDSLKMALTAVSGSAEKAQEQFIRLREVAKAPGLGFKEAIQGSVNLQAAGLAANTAERALMAFGNALGTVGKGKAELDGVITALSQIQSKGKVSAEEINQLAERLPQIRVAMQQAFGTSDTEALQKMGLTSTAFIEKIITEFEKLPKVVGGAQNSIDNFKDTMEQALAPLGQKILDAVVPAMDKLAAELGKDNPDYLKAGENIAQQIGDGVGIGLSKAIKSLPDLGSLIASQLRPPSEGFTPIYMAFGKSLMTSLVKGLQSVDGGAAFASLAKSWVYQITTVGAKMPFLGMMIVQGLIDGIKSKISEAEGTIRAMAGSLVAAAQSALQIHSPSKVFFAIGKDVAQGFIDGVASLKTGIYAAMASVFDATHIKGLNKKDAAGVEYLTAMIKELDALTPRTRLQSVVAELTAQKYAGMNKELREMILNLAKTRDAMDAKTEAMKRFQEFLDAHPLDLGKPEDQGSGVGQGQGVGGLGSSLGNNLFGPNFGKDNMNWNADEGPLSPPRTTWEDFWGMMALRMGQFRSSLPSMKEAIGENLIGGILELGNVFSNAINSWIANGENFFQAIAKGFRQMVASIIGELVRLMVYKLLMKIFGIAASAASAGIGGTHGTESIGGGDIAGMGDVGRMATGGFVSGPGSNTSDSILARLSNGEFVMSAKAVKKWGADTLASMNTGMMPAFAGGGLVGGGMSSVTTNAPVYNININGGGNQDTVRSVKQGIREATRMQQREEWRRK